MLASYTKTAPFTTVNSNIFGKSIAQLFEPVKNNKNIGQIFFRAILNNLVIGSDKSISSNLVSNKYSSIPLNYVYTGTEGTYYNNVITSVYNVKILSTIDVTYVWITGTFPKSGDPSTSTLSLSSSNNDYFYLKFSSVSSSSISGSIEYQVGVTLL